MVNLSFEMFIFVQDWISFASVEQLFRLAHDKDKLTSGESLEDNDESNKQLHYKFRLSYYRHYIK